MTDIEMMLLERIDADAIRIKRLQEELKRATGCSSCAHSRPRGLHESTCDLDEAECDCNYSGWQWRG